MGPPVRRANTQGFATLVAYHPGRSRTRVPPPRRLGLTRMPCGRCSATGGSTFALATSAPRPSTSTSGSVAPSVTSCSATACPTGPATSPATTSRPTWPPSGGAAGDLQGQHVREPPRSGDHPPLPGYRHASRGAGRSAGGRSRPGGGSLCAGQGGTAPGLPLRARTADVLRRYLRARRAHWHASSSGLWLVGWGR